MSQAQAWRYRPLVSELRQQRARQHMNWEDAARVDTAASNRVRRNDLQYIRDSFVRYRARNPWYRDRAFGTSAKAGALLSWPIVAPQVWNINKSDVARSGGAAKSEFSPGTYDARDVPFGGSAGSRARGPKNWDQPDQPWPTANDSTAGGGAGGGKHKTHFNSKVRYEKY